VQDRMIDVVVDGPHRGRGGALRLSG
jgi:hypothetical protein